MTAANVPPLSEIIINKIIAKRIIDFAEQGHRDPAAMTWPCASVSRTPFCGLFAS